MSTKFSLRKTFYAQPTYVFNLPAGHTCPYAKDCKVKVDEVTGKFTNLSSDFRCYAASSERFPAVRKQRWNNYRAVVNGEPIIVPPKATHVRIHESGDFFSQAYFDMWLEVCRNHPDVQFWAFTKSIPFWVARLGEIPSNLTLQASVGSTHDHLITEYGLKYAKVFKRVEDVPIGMEIDTDDTLAMSGSNSFALIDNFTSK